MRRQPAGERDLLAGFLAHRAVRYRTTKSIVPDSAVDTSLPANAAMLAAKAPLAASTTYKVRISGCTQAAKGGKWVQFKTRIHLAAAADHGQLRLLGGGAALLGVVVGAVPGGGTDPEGDLAVEGRDPFGDVDGVGHPGAHRPERAE